MMKEKNTKKKKNAMNLQEQCLEVLKLELGELWGKYLKEKKLYIHFIQIKGKNKGEIGSDKKEKKEPLYSHFEIVICTMEKNFQSEKDEAENMQK